MTIVAIVRRADDRVRSFFDGSAATARQRTDDAYYVFSDVPSDIDRNRCWQVRDGALAAIEPEITARDVLAARYREFRDVTDPMTTGGRQHDPDWAAYVQQLRAVTDDGEGGKDLSLAGLRSRFPTRPDGTDAISHLRGTP